MKEEKIQELKKDFYEDAIKGIMDANNGYVTAKTITELGIHRMYLKNLEDAGIIKKVGTGIYIDSKRCEDPYYVFSMYSNNVVFSHMTALYLLGLLDSNPDKEFNITIKKPYHNVRFKECKRFYVDESVFDLGLTEIKTKEGNVIKVYDIERSICDIIKSKQRMDTDKFIHCIKAYFKRKDKDINKLLDYAEKLGVKEKVMIYVEVCDE